MGRVARFGAVLAPLVVVVAMSKVHAAWVADPPYDYTGSFRFSWSIGYAVVLAIAGYGLGLPEVPRRWSQAWSSAALASMAAALVVSAAQLLVGDSLLPRFVVFGSAVAVVPVQAVLWRVAWGDRSRGESRDRVLAVGDRTDLAPLSIDFDLSPERPAILVGELAVDDATQVEGELERPLIQAVLERRASVVVLDRAALLDDGVVAQAAALHEQGVRVRSLVEFYEEWLGKLPMTELERASMFFDIGELHRARYGRLKRLVDIAGATLGLIPLGLAVPVVLLGNLAGNKGPLLFRQKRVGRNGEKFEILKFRTMLPSDGTATAWTERDDPRVTTFGKILRATHVDELPQMVNILRGDLSLVGPRPEQPHYVKDLSQKLPFYGMRHLVRPGLTGWAQVKYGYAGDERDALEKLQYEFFYLRHQSLRFDARVLARTIRSVSGGEGSGR